MISNTQTSKIRKTKSFKLPNSPNFQTLKLLNTQTSSSEDSSSKPRTPKTSSLQIPQRHFQPPDLTGASRHCRIRHFEPPRANILETFVTSSLQTFQTLKTHARKVLLADPPAILAWLKVGTSQEPADTVEYDTMSLSEPGS